MDIGAGTGNIRASGSRQHPGELRAAAAVLGVREVAVLGYHDQDLDRVDPHEAVARIAMHLRRCAPMSS